MFISIQQVPQIARLIFGHVCMFKSNNSTKVVLKEIMSAFDL